MKKRLNILCVLVILVLSYSVFESAYQVGITLIPSYKAGFEAGRKAGREAAGYNTSDTGEMVDAKKEIEKLSNLKVVSVLSDNFPFFTDSIRNEKTGEYIPMTHYQMFVSVKTSPDMWQQFAMALFSLGNIIAILLSIFFFIRLIVSINKSAIFNWKNVRRLRWLGSGLIVSFLCTAIPMWMMGYVLSNSFSLKGYSLQLSELISITNLVLGLSALIVGEVFAIGLKMKEEQDLTI